MGLRFIATDRRRLVHPLSRPWQEQPIDGIEQANRKNSLGSAGSADPETRAHGRLSRTGAQRDRGLLCQPHYRKGRIDYGLSTTDLRVRSKDRKGIVALR